MKIRLYIGCATTQNLPAGYAEDIESLRQGLMKNPNVEVLEQSLESLYICDVMIAEGSYPCSHLDLEMKVMSKSRSRTLWIFAAEDAQALPILLGGPGSLQNKPIKFAQYRPGRISDIVPIVNERIEKMRHDGLAMAIITADRGGQEIKEGRLKPFG